jgi:hypothetical protein
MGRGPTYYSGPEAAADELLQAAAMVLQMSMPTWRQTFYCAGRRYRARWDWPGVVTVMRFHTGEVMAQSVPGRPTTPAKAVKARGGARGAAR